MMLHENAGPRTLAITRVLVFGTWAVKGIADPIDRLADLPNWFLDPPRILAVFHIDGLLTAGNLAAVRWMVVLLAMAAMAGVGRGPVLLFASIAITVYQGLIRSTGHINHSELGLLYISYLLVAFPCCDAYTPHTERRIASRTSYAAAMQAIALVFCLTYVFTGVFRIAHGGLGVFTTGSMPFWILNRSFASMEFGWSISDWLIDNRWILVPADASFALMTVLEVLSPWALVNRPFRLLLLAGLSAFHLVVVATMSILFVENVLLCVILLDIESWLQPRCAKGRRIVFYDGDCGLCSRFVHFVIRHDSARQYTFAPLIGETARKHLGTLNPDSRQWSVVLSDEDGVTDRSTAFLSIVRNLGGGWRLAGVLLMVPVAIRDFAYGVVASHRYAIFGKSPICRLVSPDDRSRFLQ